MGAHVSVPMYRRSLSQRLCLEGRRCTGCERVFFPPVGGCRDCGGVLQAMVLSGRGEILAVTRITPAGAPPEFAEQARRQGGYHVAIVELAEGPKITAQLTDGIGEPTIGTPVRAQVRRLYDEEGVVRYGFKFSPQAPAAAHTNDDAAPGAGPEARAAADGNDDAARTGPEAPQAPEISG